MSNIKVASLLLGACFLAACAPSPQVIQTAIAETVEANPTSTLTPIPPTETPTKTPTETPTMTITPLPTLDIMLLILHLSEFLLEQSDFPFDAKFSSIVNSIQPIPNEEVDGSYVEKTGRIDGWSVWYGRGYANGWRETISDNVSLYESTTGAQFAITNYKLKNYSEEINPPKIGDVTSAYYQRLPYSGGRSQGLYIIYFAYKNIVHKVEGFGYEDEIAEFTRNIAQILLARLQESPLINP
jgi:hypothetical protein